MRQVTHISRHQCVSIWRRVHCMRHMHGSATVYEVLPPRVKMLLLSLCIVTNYFTHPGLPFRVNRRSRCNPLVVFLGRHGNEIHH